MSSTLRDPSQDYLAALAGCIAAQASTTGATPAWHLLNKLLGSFDALNEDEAIYRLDRFPGNVRLAPLAIALARQATLRFPHSPQAWCLYARALRQEDVGHSEEVSALERARQLCEAPDAMVLSGLSAAYDRNGQFDKADCTDQELHDALRRSGRVQDALHLAQRRYRPDANTPTWGVNLVHSMWDCGVYDDSIAILEAQHARMPHHAITTMELGSIHLRKGNWASGWANLADGVLAENSTTMDEYERRWKATLWRGEPLTGKTLFVWAELFSGDSIWLVRYLPAIAARVKALGGNLHFGCDGTLRRLFHSFAAPCIDHQAEAAALHIPLTAANKTFGFTDKTVPAGAYLTADPALVEAFRTRIERVPGRLEVALAWSGNPGHHRDHWRSMSLDAVKELLDIPGVRFHSINPAKTLEAETLAAGGHDIVAWGKDDLTDFADTAALLSNLDCVVTVDTSALHLAGALGIPTLALIDRAGSYLWGTGEGRTWWYDSVRVFRQSHLCDWRDVVARVKQALSSRATDDGMGLG